MSDTWRVEARTFTAQPWASIVDRVNRQTAGETAEFYAGRYPSWTLRLQDVSTGEVVHLGRDGKPLPVEVVMTSEHARSPEARVLLDGLMKRDLRSPEQVQADLAADRYEASLERER